MTCPPNKFWTVLRLKRLAIAFLAGVFISLIISYVNDKDNTTILKQGDFPGFYGPAVIMARGLDDRLYDQALQSEVENEFWPRDGAYYSFVYPPFVAYLLKPLGFLDQQIARNIFTALSLVCLALSFWLVTRINPLLKEHPSITLAGMLSFVPLFYGVFAGQNTPLSMLLYMGSIYFLARGTRKGDVFSGICIGLWLYKPQFGIIAILFPLLARRFYALLGFGMAALFYFLLGAKVSGFDWPITWVRTVSVFATSNFVANQQEIVSIIGAMKALGRAFDFDLLATVLAMLSCGALLLVTALPIFGVGIAGLKISSDPDTRAFGLLVSMILLGPMMALISPQTLFYDLGISAISCALFFRRLSDRNTWLLLLFFILTGLLVLYRSALALPPLVIVALLLYLYTYCSIKGSNSSKLRGGSSGL